MKNSNNNPAATVVNTPNGIQANKVLNSLADKIDKLYKNAKNIKRGFDMGFDGQWEYVIENTTTDKAIVLKQHPNNVDEQVIFVYAKSFKNQLSEDTCLGIKNIELLNIVRGAIAVISKK